MVTVEPLNDTTYVNRQIINKRHIALTPVVLRFQMGSLDEPTHVIDPDGEVMIVLEDANAPFAVWEEEKKGER